MNIYAKLQKARVMLQRINIKKSGKNTFGAGFEYFELQDLMPHINQVMNDCGLCGIVSFGADRIAQLIIHEHDGDGAIAFYTPIAEATLKAATPIQCLGAMHTYIRRYLWLLALEIVEHDAIDAIKQEETPQEDYAEKLEKASSLQELIAVWQTVPKAMQRRYTQVKDKRKAELSQPAEAA